MVGVARAARRRDGGLVAAAGGKYAVAVALSPVLERAIVIARADEVERTPEQCRGAAALARSVKPMLTSERQREIAERLAREFEEQAAEAGRRQPS